MFAQVMGLLSLSVARCAALQCAPPLPVLANVHQVLPRWLLPNLPLWDQGAATGGAGWPAVRPHPRPEVQAWPTDAGPQAGRHLATRGRAVVLLGPTLTIRSSVSAPPLLVEPQDGDAEFIAQESPRL